MQQERWTIDDGSLYLFLELQGMSLLHNRSWSIGLWAALLAGCGSSSTPRKFTVNGSDSVEPGAFVGLYDSGASFTSDEQIKATFGGTPVTLEAWDPHDLAWIVPTISAGKASLRVHGYEDVPFTVTVGAPITDPQQYVSQNYTTWMANVDAAMTSRPDDPVLAPLKANLTALSNQVATLSAADQAKLAAMIAANPWLLPSSTNRLLSFDSFGHDVSGLIDDFSDYAVVAVENRTHAFCPDEACQVLALTAEGLLRDKLQQDYQNIENEYVFKGFDEITGAAQAPAPLQLKSGKPSTVDLSGQFHALSSAESTSSNPLIRQAVTNADELPSLVMQANQGQPAAPYPVPAAPGAPVDQPEPLDLDYVTAAATGVPSGLSVNVAKGTTALMVTATISSCMQYPSGLSFTLDTHYKDPINDAVETIFTANVSCCDPSMGETMCGQACCGSGQTCQSPANGTCTCPMGTNICGMSCCNPGPFYSDQGVTFQGQTCQDPDHSVCGCGAGMPCGNECCQTGQSCQNGACCLDSGQPIFGWPGSGGPCPMGAWQAPECCSGMAACNTQGSPPASCL